MSFNRRQILATSGAALALATGWGPRGAHAAGVSATEIVVGMHSDLSGPAAAGMPALINATQLAFDQANAAGGIHGRQLRLIVEDNGSQPQLAVRAVQKLIRQDDVFAILNAFGSGTNAASIGMAVQEGRIVFAPWGASGVFHQIAGNNPLLFTTVQNYNTTTQRALEWALENWGVERIGVIYQEGPFGDLIRAGVNGALSAAGMSVTEEAAYRPGDIDFSSQVARLRAANCDLIVAGTITRETVAVAAEVKKLNWDSVKVLTSIPGRSSVVLRLGGADVEGLYGIGGWHLHSAETQDAGARAFIDAYQAVHNAFPDENAANAYSYASWFLKIIEAAGEDLTADSFAAAAQGITHDDFTTYGAFAFEANHAMPELIRIEQVQGGSWVSLSDPI